MNVKETFLEKIILSLFRDFKVNFSFLETYRVNNNNKKKEFI